MKVFGAVLAAFVLAWTGPVWAQEQINLFDAQIAVARNGDIEVTEALDVTAEGAEIRHGIFRDLPRYYETRGERLPYDYAVLEVQRDGRKERYDTETNGNAFRIRIGDPDALVPNGAHQYVLRYRVKNQVRYFDGYDEIYWNVTGNYWAFPIARARATVVLPPGAMITAAKGYTGAMGGAGADYAYTQAGGNQVFETTRPFAAGEGLTIAIGFEKGLIDSPSVGDATWLWWHRNGALAVLIGSIFGLCWFLYRSFDKVGRDPPKGPVFPRYEPPAGYSPAAVHYIYHRGLSGDRALIGTLMFLAVRGRLSIDASDKKITTLLRKRAQPAPDLANEDLALEDRLFATQQSKSFGKKYDPAFTEAYAAFRQSLARKYGNPYFRRNAFYTVCAAVVTIIAIWLAAKVATNWTIWDSAAVIALAVLNLFFMYLMPAPTPQGQAVRTEIEGFRLYMEVAEKLQLNAAKPGSEAPPPMTVERYEKFLPYAVALDVEKPWTHHFERLMPEAAKAYNAAWTTTGGSMSPARLTSSLVSHISSGVSSALPQSSSSSGSGGGGSSGGGGGGGGGGGW
jgi:uncharacterized membrane protein YgcG